MIAKVSVKGQVVIPGTPSGIRALLLAKRGLSKQSPQDEATVARAIEAVRKGKRAAGAPKNR